MATLLFHVSIKWWRQHQIWLSWSLTGAQSLRSRCRSSAYTHFRALQDKHPVPHHVKAFRCLHTLIFDACICAWIMLCTVVRVLVHGDFSSLFPVTTWMQVAVDASEFYAAHRYVTVLSMLYVMQLFFKSWMSLMVQCMLYNIMACSK